MSGLPASVEKVSRVFECAVQAGSQQRAQRERRVDLQGINKSMMSK